METTNVQTEKLPGILDLIRVMILLALFGLMICLESSAQVNTKTYNNPLQNIAVEDIIQLFELLDSIESGWRKDSINQVINHYQFLAEEIQKDMVFESRMPAGNEPGWKITFHYPAAVVKRYFQFEALMYNPLAWKN